MFRNFFDPPTIFCGSFGLMAILDSLLALFRLISWVTWMLLMVPPTGERHGSTAGPRGRRRRTPSTVPVAGLLQRLDTYHGLAWGGPGPLLRPYGPYHLKRKPSPKGCKEKRKLARARRRESPSGCRRSPTQSLYLK